MNTAITQIDEVRRLKERGDPWRLNTGPARRTHKALARILVAEKVLYDRVEIIEAKTRTPSSP